MARPIPWQDQVVNKRLRLQRRMALLLFSELQVKENRIIRSFEREHVAVDREGIR